MVQARASRTNGRVDTNYINNLIYTKLNLKEITSKISFVHTSYLRSFLARIFGVN